MRVAKGYRRASHRGGRTHAELRRAGSIRTPGLSIAGRVELGLGGAQGGGEGGRALAVVPGAVVAADGVVVGDRAAGLDQRLGDGGLDLVPLLDLAAAHRRRQDGEVGRGAVGVDVGEAAADAGRAGALGRHAADLGDRLARRLHHRRVELLEAVPGDRRLEGLREHAAGDEGVAQVRRQQKRPAPGADRVVTVAGRAARTSSPASPPWSRAIAERQVHRGVDRVVGGLEAEDQQVRAAVAGAGQLRLGGVEQAAVGGMQAGLGDLADRPRGRDGSRRTRPRRGLELGPRAHPHPGLGDHAEDPLGADQHPVRARARRPSPAAAGSPRSPAG